MRTRIQHALDFALAKEREAESFYKTWAETVTDSGVKELLIGLGAAERGHIEMLLHITPEDLITRADEPIEDLGLVQYLVDVQADPEMTLQEAMILAMKREEVSIALYERLSEFSGEASALFRGLAAEERRHKLRLETEYDEEVLREN